MRACTGRVMHVTRRLSCFAVVTFSLLTASAVTPVTNEFLARNAWSDRAFAGTTDAAKQASLKLLYEDAPEAVTRARSWRGNAFQLGEKTYAHGLAFNSTKHILVRLGRPAERFTASVGLENNDDTRRGEALGKGSVTFHVLVHKQEVFTSPTLRRKDGPRQLDVPLGGATEFEIRAGNGGDDRSWDQALWGEAEVLLRDGSRLRLQDLPWAEELESNPFPFSFQIGDQDSATFLGQCRREMGARTNNGCVQRELIWSDPRSRLQVRLEWVIFADFPAIEWTLGFKNLGTSNTPILQKIQALDAPMPLALAGNPTLHCAKGATANFADFGPETTLIKPETRVRLQAGEGRSSSQVLPFFNLEGAGGGIISAVGWSGNWAAEFSRNSRGQVQMTTGMERTHLVLHPGESIRSPKMLVLFYEGDRWRGQNLLRQFVLAHHRPSPGGKPLVAPITCGNWGATHAAIHLDNIDKIVRHELPIDYYWIDAEWYGQGTWPVNVGNWKVKGDVYPDSFKPLSEKLRGAGRELMLWFEPERVYRNSAWHKEHRDWLIDIGNDNLLFNLGNPEALKFLVEFISSRITEFGLGCYRQDFNMDPLPYWRAVDSPDRQGMAEIKYIEGLYAFWDGLLKRHPNLILDNCASGGRRIDLETIGRATPFWRTDGPRDPIAHQCHSFGLLPWVPLSATSQDRAGDDYEFRSSMCSSLCLNWWVSGDAPAAKIPDSFPFAWAKSTLREYLGFRKFYYGDFYPLTTYSQDAGLWLAYQLDRPDQGGGLVIVLRRPESPYQAAQFTLRGLDRGAAYRIRNLDTGNEATYLADKLLSEGLPVSVDDRPGSALFLYQREN
ncbi:MAG TPA: alpha-galactosidase [Clostridia bacterium]|nr:alpha-galactosidase [Clostridia bacterium]